MIEVFKENFNGDLLLLVYGLEHVYYFEDGVSDVEILDHVWAGFFLFDGARLFNLSHI